MLPVTAVMAVVTETLAVTAIDAKAMIRKSQRELAFFMLQEYLRLGPAN